MGQEVNASFTLSSSVLEVTTKDGDQKRYPGKHVLIFTRGDVEDEQHFPVDVPEVEELVV